MCGTESIGLDHKDCIEVRSDNSPGLYVCIVSYKDMGRYDNFICVTFNQPDSGIGVVVSGNELRAVVRPRHREDCVAILIWISESRCQCSTLQRPYPN